MSRLSRTLFWEIASSALLGSVLFTFVLFLQRVSRLFEQLVRGSASPETVGTIFALLLPPALTFTIPIGVLVGTLIALSRMSSDAEITAMRASGISSRRVLRPVLAFGFLGMMLTAAASMWLNPLSVRQMYKLLTKVAAAQLTAEIQPRVFEEQFPNTILYVGDVVPGPVVRWRDVFLADVSPSESRKKSAGEPGEGPSITIASEAIAVPEPERNRIQLTLVNGSTHVAGKDPLQYYSSRAPRSDQVLEAAKRGEIRPFASFVTMDMGPLLQEARTSLDARIELHQRLAVPPACLLLALIGVPLGVSWRRGGKSGAFVITVAVALLYWTGFIGFVNLAKQGKLPAEVALWVPNAVLLAMGLWLVARMEKPTERDVFGGLKRFGERLYGRVRGNLPNSGPSIGRQIGVGGQIIDYYVLSTFVFYFVLLLVSFVVMTEVYTFFELLGDILKNNIALSTVAKYLFYLAPKLVYDSTPMSVLVAVLVTFGVMTKNNEVTAIKACGISLYRLAVPVLLASTALSGALFAFDHYVVPDANRIQDGLRAQIKGRPVQTYLRPDRKWIRGEGSRIYYYKYFEPNEGVMLDINVYDLHPQSFRLQRHISAERARWEPSLNSWIFQNGWSREFKESSEVGLRSFQGQTATFPELNEPPHYFLKEVKQDKQMNFQELAAYIDELRQSGFDTIRLQVQFHKKFAVPLFAAIMALLSVPFAFLAAHRGAMAGVGVSFGIAMAYWMVNQVFEQVGYVNQLPAAIAAWAPDAVFTLGGLYFLARMKT